MGLRDGCRRRRASGGDASLVTAETEVAGYGGRRMIGEKAPQKRWVTLLPPQNPLEPQFTVVHPRCARTHRDPNIIGAVVTPHSAYFQRLPGGDERKLIGAHKVTGDSPVKVIQRVEIPYLGGDSGGERGNIEEVDGADGALPLKKRFGEGGSVLSRSGENTEAGYGDFTFYD